MSRLSGYNCIKILFVIAIVFFPLVPQYVHAQAGEVNTTKTITPNFVTPGETMEVKIKIEVTGDPVGSVADVSVVLDRTGSMMGQKFGAAKQSAKIFVDLFEQDNNKMQIIDFAEQAFLRKDFTFTNETGKTELKTAIDMIPSPLGLTNLFGAFERSVEELVNKSRPNTYKAIVFLTDGRPTVGESSLSAFTDLAELVANNSGGVFTIGLGDDVNATLLQAMADAGNGEYLFAPTSQDLEELFRRVADTIQSPPATNIRVTENLPTDLVTYNDDASIPPNSTSNDDPVSTLNWNIDRILIDNTWEVNFTVTAQKRVVTTTSLSPTTIIYDRAQSDDIRVDLPPGFAVREVATTSISQNATILTEGNVLQVNATIDNLGTLSENFPVVLRMSRLDSGQDTELEVSRTTVNLASGSSTQVTFNWNTSLWVSPFQDDQARFGQWNVSVTADPDEQIFGDDPSNNTRVGDIITVNTAGEGTLPVWWIIILLPFMIIPAIAAVLLGKRKGFPVFPTGRVMRPSPPPLGTTSRMVCPKCYAPLTFMNNYQKWYCQACRRYV
jgi:uncharacterized protein YegL